MVDLDLWHSWDLDVEPDFAGVTVYCKKGGDVKYVKPTVFDGSWFQCNHCGEWLYESAIANLWRFAREVHDASN